VLLISLSNANQFPFSIGFMEIKYKEPFRFLFNYWQIRTITGFRSLSAHFSRPLYLSHKEKRKEKREKRKEKKLSDSLWQIHFHSVCQDLYIVHMSHRRSTLEVYDGSLSSLVLFLGGNGKWNRNSTKALWSRIWILCLFSFLLHSCLVGAFSLFFNLFKLNPI
jgi:hypothetical protein